MHCAYPASVQTFRCEAEVVDLVKRHARRSLATIASEDGVPKVDDDLFCIDDDCAPVIRLLAEWFNIVAPYYFRGRVSCEPRLENVVRVETGRVAGSRISRH
jgi:hypothetical protein